MYESAREEGRPHEAQRGWVRTSVRGGRTLRRTHQGIRTSRRVEAKCAHFAASECDPLECSERGVQNRSAKRPSEERAAERVTASSGSRKAYKEERAAERVAASDGPRKARIEERAAVRAAERKTAPGTRAKDSAKPSASDVPRKVRRLVPREKKIRRRPSPLDAGAGRAEAGGFAPARSRESGRNAPACPSVRNVLFDRSFWRARLIPLAWVSSARTPASSWRAPERVSRETPRQPGPSTARGRERSARKHGGRRWCWRRNCSGARPSSRGPTPS